VHLRLAHTSARFFAREPAPQVKLAHVGGGGVVVTVVPGVVVTVVPGVVVTVEQGPLGVVVTGGVVVTVVPGVVVTVEQGPLGVVVTGGVVVTVVPGVVVTVEQGAFTVVVTVVPGVVVTVEQGALVGGGVVVTVVTMLQHLCEQHFSSCAFPHMMTPPLGEKPAGQAYVAQVFGGWVAVVQGLGPAVGLGATGATVPQGLPASTALSKAKESNTFMTAMTPTATKKRELQEYE